MGKYLDLYLSQFHQDIFAINDTLEEAIDESLESLRDEEKKHLKAELTEISKNPNVRFVDLWNNSKSPFRLENEQGAREILEVILARL